jgi:hypothetical protein
LDICQFKAPIRARVAQVKYNNETVDDLRGMLLPKRDSWASTLMADFVIKMLEVFANIKGAYDFDRLF